MVFPKLILLQDTSHKWYKKSMYASGSINSISFLVHIMNYSKIRILKLHDLSIERGKLT